MARWLLTTPSQFFAEARGLCLMMPAVPRPVMPDHEQLDDMTPEESQYRIYYWVSLIAMYVILTAVACEVYAQTLVYLRRKEQNRRTRPAEPLLEQQEEPPWEHPVSVDATRKLHKTFQAATFTLLFIAFVLGCIDESQGLDWEFWAIWYIGMSIQFFFGQTRVLSKEGPIKSRFPMVADKVIMAVTPNLNDSVDTVLDMVFVFMIIAQGFGSRSLTERLLCIAFAMLGSLSIIFPYRLLYADKASMRDLREDFLPLLEPTDQDAVPITTAIRAIFQGNYEVLKGYLVQKLVATAQPFKLKVACYEDLPQAALKALYTIAFGGSAMVYMMLTLSLTKIIVFYVAAVQFSSAGTMKALGKKLHHVDANVREGALESIGRMGKKAAPLVGVIQEVAQKDADWGVRYRACSALGNIGPEALPAVTELAKDEPWQVRVQACMALGKIGPEAAPALESLVKIAKQDEDKYVRNAAFKALGDIGPEAATL